MALQVWTVKCGSVLSGAHSTETLWCLQHGDTVVVVQRNIHAVGIDSVRVQGAVNWRRERNRLAQAGSGGAGFPTLSSLLYSSLFTSHHLSRKVSAHSASCRLSISPPDLVLKYYAAQTTRACIHIITGSRQ